MEVMHQRLKGLPLLFIPNLSHYFAYDGVHILASFRQCRMNSTPHLEFVLDHEVSHHYDDILMKSQFPGLEKWLLQRPSERKYRILINAYLELFRRRLPEKGSQEMNRALEDLFHDSKISRLKPEERLQKLRYIRAYLAEALRFGEEVFDERLQWVVLERDFTNLFKMPPALFEKEKAERSDLYLEHCLVAAGLEEAGVLAVFQRRPDINPGIFNLIERRHIELLRLLIRAASRYFPIIGELKP